jgi:hypothetical protein
MDIMKQGESNGKAQEPFQHNGNGIHDEFVPSHSESLQWSRSSLYINFSPQPGLSHKLIWILHNSHKLIRILHNSNFSFTAVWGLWMCKVGQDLELSRNPTWQVVHWKNIMSWINFSFQFRPYISIQHMWRAITHPLEKYSDHLIWYAR